MDKRRVIEAPEGYGERVRLALRAAGRVADIARACGVSELYVYQARSGHRGWSEPSKLAAVAGVDEKLLVYGPTAALAEALGCDDGVKYDAVVEALCLLNREACVSARVTPATMDMLKREHHRRHGVLWADSELRGIVIAGILVERDSTVPAGHVVAVPVVVS